MINQARTPASVGDNDEVTVANEELMPDAFLFIYLFFFVSGLHNLSFGLEIAKIAWIPVFWRPKVFCDVKQNDSDCQ